MLLSYKASYGGFIDRRTRAADNPELLTPSSSNPVQGKSSRSRTPSIPEEPIRLADEVSTSSSRGYSPSPPSPGQEMNQPINLSNLLTLPRRGQGRGTIRGHEDSQGHGRWADVHSNIPPGLSPDEVAEGHRDKRQRLDATSMGAVVPEGNLTTRRSSTSIPIWAPRLSHRNHPVSVRVSAAVSGLPPAWGCAKGG